MYRAIEQLSDKYAQYSDLLSPLLEINNINHQFWVFDDRYQS